MKIIKSKINNFLLPLFFLTLFLNAQTPHIYAQNEPAAEEEVVSPNTQNQPPTAEETPNVTQKKETKPETKPTENQTPPQTSEKPPQSAPTAEQPETKNQKLKPQKNESSTPQKNSSEAPKELDLPEVSDKEVQESSSPNLELPPKSNENIIKISVSWLLMIIGLLIIIKVIISNFKIPRNYEPHIKNKHSFKSGKRRNKYSLKYK